MKKLLILLLLPFFTFAQFNPVAFYEYGANKYKPFVSTWKTDNVSTGSTAATQVKLPLYSSGNYNFTVDWGDGTSDRITVWNQAETTHTYSVVGTYTIKITDTCIGWSFNDEGDRLKILSIKTWGKLRLGTIQGGYFYGCTNLNLSTVEDILDLTGVTSFNSFFKSCYSLTTVGRINEWNTGNVTNMSFMFYNTILFNQDVGAWNVSSCSDFTGMFSGSKFNNGGSSNINNWILKSTGSINMTSMFFNANVFNQPIGNWNVSNVTNMTSMFQYSSVFNQNIGAWNVSNVTNMSFMFFGAGAFNNGGSPDINNWVTTSLTNTSKMFSKDSTRNVINVFNQPIGNWDMSKVTDVSYMFGAFQNTAPCIFNQNIGAWNLSSCSNFTGMFALNTSFNNGGSPSINNWALKTTGTINMIYIFDRAVSFNQPIGSWNTIAVTNMGGMFQGASSFNNGLASGVPGTMSWNTGNVTNMNSMFSSGLGGGNPMSFNQHIGSWNVSNVTDMGNMFANSNTGIHAFNQPIGSWNVSKVTNMSNMFGGSTGQNSLAAFNQDIGSWNVSNVTNFTKFLHSKTPASFSTANLDAIYNSTTGWASRPVKPNLSISFGTAEYTAGASAGKLILTGAPNNWVITDGGL